LAGIKSLLEYTRSVDLFNQIKSEKMVPLPERMRPRHVDEVLGQDHLLAPGKPLRQLLQNPQSMIFWGPPGVGKTTLARLVAGERPFRQMSAVLAGVQELRKLVEETRYRSEQPVLFIDEIHRWNKAQQDSLLPYVEDGSIILIGATTENPSFSIISPLLSRSRVFVLQTLKPADIEGLLRKALSDPERGLGDKGLAIDDDALALIVEMSGGDARRALNMLETAASLATHITLTVVNESFSRRTLRYDKAGEQHYDIISAFIKSMRGSDVDASIYYLARMVEAGEDPKFICRRMMIFATEDIGMADPRALQVTVSAAEAYDRIGQAEGWIPLSFAATYLATAPKSNASYAAYKAAKIDIEATGDLPVPMHLRNAPTEFMKDLGYGKGYQYAHDQSDAQVQHAHLPEELVGKKYYRSSGRGFEKLLWAKHQQNDPKYESQS
jgi:putative ATPase